MNTLIFMIVTTALLWTGALFEPPKAYADITSCDDLAALEADPMAQSAPVGFDDIQPDAVISACLAALTDPLFQDHITQDATLKPRLFLQLGRGYLANGEMAKALAYFNQSSDEGYPAGYFALGVFHLLGEDGEQNLNAAHPALIKAFDGGVIWAARALSMLHLQENTAFYDPKKAAYYQSQWAAR